MAKETGPKPDIVIPETTGSNPPLFKIVSQKEFDEHKKEFNVQKGIQNWTLGLVIGVTLVCFIAFVTFMIDSWKFYGDTTNEYRKTIDQLKTENSNLKLKALEDRIKILESNNSSKPQNGHYTGKIRGYSN